MERNSCYLHILGLVFSLNVVIESMESEINYIPAPTNITAQFSGPFQIMFTWEPSDVNCTPEYEVVVTSLKPIRAKENTPMYILDISIDHNRLNLNYYFSVKIQANCNGMKSEWARRSHLQLVPGNERTSVKNLNCVWHYKKYIECTWQPGDEVPPNVQYRLLYWEKDTYTGNLSKSSQLQDLLRTGNECQDYFQSGGMYLGCKLKYEHNIVDKNLMFVVTDTSYSIKPFFNYAPARDIGKLQSPNITYASKLEDNHLYVNWTVSHEHHGLTFEGLVSSDTWDEPFTTEQCCSMNVAIPHSEDTLRVKVRVKFAHYVGDIQFWSDWSEEFTVEGKGNNTTSLLLLIIIPATVLVLTVLLLVYLKRLKILVCPPIPHPEKIFQNDRQHWLKHERPTNVYNKPEQVDISPVSLLEV